MESRKDVGREVHLEQSKFHCINVMVGYDILGWNRRDVEALYTSRLGYSHFKGCRFQRPVENLTLQIII